MYSEIYIKPTKEKLQKKASIFGTLNNFSRHRSKNSGGSAGAALASSRDGYAAAPGAEMTTSVFNDAGKNWPR